VVPLLLLLLLFSASHCLRRCLPAWCVAAVLLLAVIASIACN
jgi:hypothetical protein